MSQVGPSRYPNEEWDKTKSEGFDNLKEQQVLQTSRGNIHCFDLADICQILYYCYTAVF